MLFVDKVNDASLRLYGRYVGVKDGLAGRLRALVADQRGQSGETSMLMRVSLVVAILIVVGGLLYGALTALGVDVAGRIRHAVGRSVRVGVKRIGRRLDPRHPPGPVVAVCRPVPVRVLDPGEPVARVVREFRNAQFRRRHLRQVATTVHRKRRPPPARVLDALQVVAAVVAVRRAATMRINYG